MRVGQLSAIDFVSKVLASLLGFVATIYFARVLGADTLGTYYLILSVVGWMSLFGTMGIGSGLVKRISEGTETGEYLSAGGLSMAIFFILISGVLFGLQGVLDSYVGVPAYTSVIGLLCVGLAGSFVDAVLQGQRLVHIYSLLKPVRRAVRSLFQVGAVILGLELTGLVTGYAFGGVIAVLLGVVFISFNLKIPKRTHFESLFNYAKYAWLGQLKSKTFNRADILILGVFVVPSLVGVYAIAWNIAGFLAIFSSSISSALFPEVSNVSTQIGVEESTGIVQDAIGYAGLITLPGFVGSIILGENILSLYGQEFTQGSFILILLIAASVVYDYQKIAVSTLSAIDRPDLSFRVNAVLVISNVILNVVLIYSFGWIGAAVATLLSAGLSLAVGYLLLIKMIDVSFPIRSVSTQVISALVMGVAVVGVERLLIVLDIRTMRALASVALVLFGASTYLIVLLVISPRFRETVLTNLDPITTRIDIR
jgi:O-antigen/teichoic acid export membrane protein